jgi:hypothetical protein
MCQGSVRGVLTLAFSEKQIQDLVSLDILALVVPVPLNAGS